MAPARNTITAALTTLALLVTPTAALGQSAGDEQYADPLKDAPSGQTESGGNGSQGKRRSGTNPGAGNSGSSSPESGTGTATTPVPQVPPTATSSRGTAAELPRTGSDTAPVALAGGLLLVAGTLLRRGPARRRSL